MFENAVIPLNLEVTFEDQKSLIEWALENANDAAVEDEVVEPFWIGRSLRSLREPFAINEVEEYRSSRLPYLLRMNGELQWDWEPGVGADIVKRVLLPIMPAFESLNRVTIVLQKPGKPVPAHRDLVVGDTYAFMKSPYSTRLGSSEMEYHGEEWFFEKYKGLASKDRHKRQNYLGLRIPLSERPDSSGKPFVKDHRSGEISGYSTGNRIFLLDESSLFHGAEAVEFFRGVVIVDGELDLNVLSAFYDKIEEVNE